MRLRKLLHDRTGASALEFALVAPVFITLLVSVAQLGIVFLANAGLNNAVAQGSRYATIYHPDFEGDNFEDAIKDELIDKIEAAEFGLDPDRYDLEDPVSGVTAGGSTYVDITMTYTIPLNFIVVQKDVTLTQTRRAFIQAIPENNPA